MTNVRALPTCRAAPDSLPITGRGSTTSTDSSEVRLLQVIAGGAVILGGA